MMLPHLAARLYGTPLLIARAKLDVILAVLGARNIVPNRYGRLESLNLFPAKPVRTRRIIVEERNSALNLLPTMPPGSPGTVGVRGKRKLRSFVVPHIPHDDVVLPEEVQGLRAFGSETEMEAIAGVMARYLETMRNKHAITLEHLRMGALKGAILGADGSELYDLFGAFEITPKTMPFALETASTNVKNKCIDLMRYVEDSLLGEYRTGVHVLCSPESFSKLTGHPKVEKAYENWQQGVIAHGARLTGYRNTCQWLRKGSSERQPIPGNLGSSRYLPSSPSASARVPPSTMK